MHKELTANEVREVTQRVKKAGRVWLDGIKRFYSIRPRNHTLMVMKAVVSGEK